MPIVVSSLPQLSGVVWGWAGWPGSNGSTMAANGGAVLAAAADG